jgi:hypothetical protein
MLTALAQNVILSYVDYYDGRVYVGEMYYASRSMNAGNMRNENPSLDAPLNLL